VKRANAALFMMFAFKGQAAAIIADRHFAYRPAAA